MKNFKKRFLHAAKHTRLQSMRISLRRRLFMGKNILVTLHSSLGNQKTAILCPLTIINQFAKFRHWHRANNYLIKHSINHA